MPEAGSSRSSTELGLPVECLGAFHRGEKAESCRQETLAQALSVLVTFGQACPSGFGGGIRLCQQKGPPRVPAVWCRNHVSLGSSIPMTPLYCKKSPAPENGMCVSHDNSVTPLWSLSSSLIWASPQASLSKLFRNFSVTSTWSILVEGKA